jgi:hypothetical protein
MTVPGCDFWFSGSLLVLLVLGVLSQMLYPRVYSMTGLLLPTRRLYSLARPRVTPVVRVHGLRSGPDRDAGAGS